MRLRVAQLLAAATGVAILLLAVLFAYIQHQRQVTPRVGAPPEAAPADTSTEAPREDRIDDAVSAPVESRADRGKQVYRDVNCSVCHSIAGAGNRRYPLDDVGARLSPDTIRRWIVDPRSIDPSVRKPDYTNLPDGDLDALVAYLTALRGSGP